MIINLKEIESNGQLVDLIRREMPENIAKHFINSSPYGLEGKVNQNIIELLRCNVKNDILEMDHKIEIPLADLGATMDASEFSFTQCKMISSSVCDTTKFEDFKGFTLYGATSETGKWHIFAIDNHELCKGHRDKIRHIHYVNNVICDDKSFDSCVKEWGMCMHNSLEICTGGNGDNCKDCKEKIMFRRNINKALHIKCKGNLI